MDPTNPLPEICLDCGRVGTHHARFLGTWQPVCRYHIASYSDLPNHRTADPLRRPHTVELDQELEAERAGERLPEARGWR